TGSLSTPRWYHVATLLPNQTVLVAGGFAGTGFIASAEIYSPASGTWSNTGSLTLGRSQATASLLPNGKVLLAGGFKNPLVLTNADIYNPATGTWSPTSPLGTGRYDHTGTLLANGKVLITGGDSLCCGPIPNVEVYDYAAGFWTSISNDLQTNHTLHTATLL